MSGDELRDSNYDVECSYQKALKENELLNAKVAMLREALEYLQEQTRPISKTQEALSATEQDVTRWVNGIKADGADSVLEYAFEKNGDLYVRVDTIQAVAKQLRGGV